MKSLLLSCLVLLGITVLVVSCQKERLGLEADPITSEGINETLLDNPVAASASLPDLKITSYTTTVTARTTRCNPVVIVRPFSHQIAHEGGGSNPVAQTPIIAVPFTCPDITCSGQRNFMATVVITNVGTANLPAGSISVKWRDWAPGEGSMQTQTQTHTGIPAGGTYSMTRSYYMGPCDCIPGGYHKHNFQATVDPDNLIVESNELNNLSAIWKACHGC